MISDDDIFTKKDDGSYLIWQRNIKGDRPANDLLPSDFFQNDGKSLQTLSLDTATALEVEKSQWKGIVGFIEEDKPVGSPELASYSSAAVSIACSSNGAPYVARSIFGYNRPLANLSDTISLFRLGNIVLPALYQAIEKSKSENRSCPGLKEILDAWPLETKLPLPDNKGLNIKSTTPNATAKPESKAKRGATKG